MYWNYLHAHSNTSEILILAILCRSLKLVSLLFFHVGIFRRYKNPLYGIKILIMYYVNALLIIFCFLALATIF